jgi:predicted small secreted protein
MAVNTCPVKRLLIVVVVLAATAVSSSCTSSGLGVGVNAGTRWGGDNGPGVYVGGPAGY